MKNLSWAAVFIPLISVLAAPLAADAGGYTKISEFKGHPPIHIYGSATLSPTGLTPSQIKAAYNLPQTGGRGTIAIIGAYNDKTIETDLRIFSSKFGLPACTEGDHCFEQHLMSSNTGSNSGWSMETSLDVEWAHAIAPKAKILLVEAKTASGTNLLHAIDYAASRSDVVAISMSWGGAEFSTESTLDSHFVSKSGATFFASSGDNGAGVSWPAVSKNVVGVGGTTVHLTRSGNFSSETAWSGSGGGISQFESQPSYQGDYSIPKAGGKRAVPDVSYNADPASGFSIYKTTGTSGKGWYVVGGTSAGAPQWAAIQSLGLTASNSSFYSDKAGSNSKNYFRDIISGSNGDCSYYCDARKRYDYVTGLGSPLTDKF